MSRSILPSGEELHVTPDEILRYVGIDTLRQILRQTRLHLTLKPNRDCDYYGNQTLHKYSGDLHNDGVYQRMEIRTFPDNGAYQGYAGVNNDSGEFGIQHNIDKWDHALSSESLKQIINRTQIGALARVPDKLGYGVDDNGDISTTTSNRQAAIIFDPYDGRPYVLSNDDPLYVNNETRGPDTKIPLRAIARIGDIPTRMSDFANDLSFVSDPDYKHTDNNFTTSNRYVLDNIDDRTFVFPEIARDRRGEPIENYRVGLGGKPSYGESDGEDYRHNSQPDLGENPDLGDHGDRLGEAINSYNANQHFSGVAHRPGFLPGIFRSLEELERVDLVDQTRTPLTHQATPGARRPYNYYSFDGIWAPNWFDRSVYNDSYLAQSMHPTNMELRLPDREPVPYSQIAQSGELFNQTKLYQWRYNRISVKYHSENLIISIVSPGANYKVGDVLRWTFASEVIMYKVLVVGPNGQIQRGEYHKQNSTIFEQDPSTHGVGISFTNFTGVGRGALLSVSCAATITAHATQIKNNLYAYVDVVPTVRSDNTSPWSDINPPDTQDGLVNVRSTAAFPAYSGVNSGRGGPAPNPSTSKVRYHEHGGNATAGVHVHLFRYVINTQSPTWVVRNGIQVFTGRWVDQGPLGVERPCDIKALLFSNPDTNNFNNYYKFMLDAFLDSINRIPDAVSTNNPNATSLMRLHMDEKDPTPDRRFYEDRVHPDTSLVHEVDITDKVLYVNAATGVLFMYNTSRKNDPNFGYGARIEGWFPIAGVTAR